MRSGSIAEQEMLMHRAEQEIARKRSLGKRLLMRSKRSVSVLYTEQEIAHAQQEVKLTIVCRARNFSARGL